MNSVTRKKDMSDDNLERAIALSRSGKKAEARELLKAILRSNPQNETAWLWFADTFPDNLNRVAVLEECLKNNPDSQATQKWLATFKSEEAKTATMIQPQESGTQTNQIAQPKQPIIKPFTIRNLSQEPNTNQSAKSNSPYIFLASAFGTIILLSICIFGLWILQRQGMLTIPAVENPLSLSTAQAITLTPTFIFTPINTPTQANTSTPTFTSTPINTPTITSSQTPINSATPQPTPTPLPPTNTQTRQPTIPIQNTPSPEPTSIDITPTPEQPTVIPTKHNTPTRPPQTSVSCGISPSVVPGAAITIITFYANFSPPKDGLGFFAEIFEPKYSGQKGCGATDGTDGNIDGYAYCDGQSGLLPYNKTIKVTFNTSVGVCYATYRSR